MLGFLRVSSTRLRKEVHTITLLATSGQVPLITNLVKAAGDSKVPYFGIRVVMGQNVKEGSRLDGR